MISDADSCRLTDGCQIYSAWIVEALLLALQRQFSESARLDLRRSLNLLTHVGTALRILPAPARPRANLELAETQRQELEEMARARHQ
jgi:hypothetical protein